MTKSYLGKLCLRGHDFENTGQSLRYLNTRVCVKCQYEAMRKKTAKYKQEQALIALAQENAELKRQLILNQDRIWYVMLIDNKVIPINAIVEAEKLHGRMVLAVDKKPGANAYASFAFEDVSSATSFYQKMSARVLIISRPNTSPQINIDEFGCCSKI